MRWWSYVENRLQLDLRNREQTIPVGVHAMQLGSENIHIIFSRLQPRVSQTEIHVLTPIRLF